MKNHIATDPRFDASDQERLMALLALTAQALPSAAPPFTGADSALNPADEVENEFVRLDADPAAMESYLRRGMKKTRMPQQAKEESRWLDLLGALSSWLAPPRIRMAAALGVALLAVAVVYWQSSTRDSLLSTVEQSYADVTFGIPSGALVLPWERDAASLGFTPTAGNDSLGGRAFAQGLLRGQARLSNANAANQATSAGRPVENYIALGEWNVLLWAASQPDVGADVGSGVGVDAHFWQRQLSVARRFAAASYASEDDAIVGRHLAAIEPMLAELSRDANAQRIARQLAGELTRFREAFAPHTPTALNPSP